MCFDGSNEDNDPLRGEGHFSMSPLNKGRNWSSQIALASWKMYKTFKERTFQPGYFALDLHNIWYKQEWLPTPILPVCDSPDFTIKKLTGSKDDNGESNTHVFIFSFEVTDLIILTVHPLSCGGAHGPETERVMKASNFQNAEVSCNDSSNLRQEHDG